MHYTTIFVEIRICQQLASKYSSNYNIFDLFYMILLVKFKTTNYLSFILYS